MHREGCEGLEFQDLNPLAKMGASLQPSAEDDWSTLYVTSIVTLELQDEEKEEEILQKFRNRVANLKQKILGAHHQLASSRTRLSAPPLHVFLYSVQIRVDVETVCTCVKQIIKGMQDCMSKSTTFACNGHRSIYAKSDPTQQNADSVLVSPRLSASLVLLVRRRSVLLLSLGMLDPLLLSNIVEHLQELPGGSKGVTQVVRRAHLGPRALRCHAVG